MREWMEGGGRERKKEKGSEGERKEDGRGMNMM